MFLTMFIGSNPGIHSLLVIFYPGSNPSLIYLSKGLAAALLKGSIPRFLVGLFPGSNPSFLYFN